MAPARILRRPGLLRDAGGAFTAAFVQMPVEAAYGVIALAPLGPQYAPIGVLSALYSACVSNAVAGLAGSRMILGGPRTSLTLLVAALCAVLAGQPAFRSGDGIDLPKVMGFLSLGLLLAGLLQVALGRLRWGSVTKYVPYPVRAGLMTGLAVLLIESAWRPMLGVPADIDWRDPQRLLASVRPADLAVAATVLLLMSRPLRFLPLPRTLVALLAGIGLHHALGALLGGPAGGATLAAIPAPSFDAAIPRAWGELLADPAAREHLRLLVPFSLSILLLGTLESLLVASQFDSITGRRRDSNREAAAQGWSNVAGALIGAQPSGGAVARTVICHVSGGHSQASVYFYSGFIAAGMLFAPEMLQEVPMSAAAAVLAASSVFVIDDWVRSAPRQLLARTGLPRAQRRMLAVNYGFMLLVAGAMMATSIPTALLLGVLVSMILFVRSNSRTIVRGVVHGDVRRSIKVRAPAAMESLAAKGRRIALLTLEGALFFGTADQLADRIHGMIDTVDFVILDLKRVTEIDPTGGRILDALARDLAVRNKHLVLCELGSDDAHGGKLLAIESMQAGSGDHAFVVQPDVDRALEWAEDRLLEEAGVQTLSGRPLTLGETMLGKGMSPAELERLAAVMTEEHFRAGEYIFHAGDHGDSLYLSTSGEISILLPAQGPGRGKRIVSFAPGVVFGELAVLEGKPRSADAVAEADLTVIRLTAETLDRLHRDDPVLAGKILLNLSLHLSARMRSLTNELSAALSA